MNPKRELTSVDLAALERELANYEGARVEKVYLYDDGLVRFKMREYELGRIELLVDTGEFKHVRVATPERVPQAPERPPNFAMMLRNRLEGAHLDSVEQFEFDRILSLEFKRSGESTTIVAELFGDGNLAVLDNVGEVVDCLNTVRLKSRTVVPGSPYEYPEARFNPLAVDSDHFKARIEDSDTDLVRTLATRLNFGGIWAEELCTRAGVEKVVDIEEVTEEMIDAVYNEVERLREQIASGDFDPRLYTDDGRPLDVTPLPMQEHADLDEEHFDRFTEALDIYATNLDSDEAEHAAPQRPDFEAEIEKKQRIIDQQEGAISNFDEQSEAEQQKAESLYAHYDLVDEILRTVRAARTDGTPWEEIEERFEQGKEQGIAAAEAVKGVDGSEGTVTVSIEGKPVRLFVSDGVEKNADRLYQESKRIQEKKAGAQAAIENTREELAEIKSRRDEWDADDSDAAVQEEAGEQRDIDWLARSSVPVRKSDNWYDRFRWFYTSDDFLVIGGRNADQNEEIVKKYLDRGDLFFHAQAHGGPVTVLKATDPSESYDEDIVIPERSKEEAAQFAVSYSSVWKDAKFSGDAYMVDHTQVSKTPESGEFLEKGGFAIRGDRTYFRDVPVGVAVGITCEPETRVVGGPPAAVSDRAESVIEVEPGKYAQNDIAKRVYREFRTRFADESFVRKIASPDLIQKFLPPGQSSMKGVE